MKKVILFLLLFLVALPSLAIAAETFAGTVKNVKGDAFVDRGKSTLPLKQGMKIYANDLIRTDKDGAVGIILQDNTIFSLGPNSQLALNEFVFFPDEGRFSLLVKMIKGTFVYISGVIGKLSPESIEVETPVGTIAIRGTRFVAKIAGD